MSEPAERRARRQQGQRLLDRLAADYLDRAGVHTGSMFGSTGLRADGKFFAFVGADGGLIVKVPAARAAALVAAGEATPVRVGRNPTRQWIDVALPAADQDSGPWPVLLSEAYEYASVLSQRFASNTT